MNAIDSGKACIFIPFAGGSGLSFEILRRSLSAFMPVVGVTYKGRYQSDMKQAPQTVEAMADEVIALIDSLPVREIVIFGYSLGAIVAYEVARRKKEFSPSLVALVVAACRAPQLFSCDQVTLDSSEDAFIQTVSRFGAIPDSMLRHSAAKQRMVPSLLNDFRAAARYKHAPGALIELPITVLSGKSDPFAPVSDVVAWQENSLFPARFEFFDGDHFFVTQHIPIITKIIIESDTYATPLPNPFQHLETSVQI